MCTSNILASRCTFLVMMFFQGNRGVSAGRYFFEILDNIVTYKSNHTHKDHAYPPKNTGEMKFLFL
jgi:hypothetical protein